MYVKSVADLTQRTEKCKDYKEVYCATFSTSTLGEIVGEKSILITERLNSEALYHDEK